MKIRSGNILGQKLQQKVPNGWLKSSQQILQKTLSRLSIFILLPLLFQGCGYRFGRGEALAGYQTVSIPYASGDRRGIFTSLLIQEVVASGALSYSLQGGDLLLQTTLLPLQEVNVEYRYAPADEGDHYYSKIVVPVEARMTLGASFVLIERCTGKVVFGPCIVKTTQEFDFEADLGNVDQNTFSLGQLEMHNEAQEAALPPIYRRLAEKIVDYLKNSW